MKRPIGTITRGTTFPNRLRKIDNWIVWRYQSLLTHSAAPHVVDLGYGASPVTTHELASRLAGVNAHIRVTGLEIDPSRVESAQLTSTSQVTFALGGFEVPVQDPLIIRAFNVLRQYDETEVKAAWELMQKRLLPEGRIVEGTCDEPGRLAVWVELDSSSPLTLTFAAATQHLSKVSDLAPRLPKVLIHHNTVGHPVHAFFTDADAAWHSHAALRIFGARQRWAATLRSLRGSWPVQTPPSRATLGEITIDWRALTA